MKRILLVSLAISVFFVIIVINVCLYLPKYAVSNCKVFLVGLKINDTESEVGVFKKAKDIVDMMFGSFNEDGNIPDLGNDRFSLILAVENGNFFSFTIDAAEVRLDVNDKKIASGKLSEERKIQIRAGEKIEIQLPLKVSMIRIAANMRKIFMADEIRYRAQGDVKLDTFLGKLTYHLDVKKMNLPIL